MAQNTTALRLPFVCTSLTILSLLTPLLTTPPAHALTASMGQPYRGHLVNGVPFPHQFHGYYLRDEDHTYGTPELVGAVLDAIEKVLVKYPDSPDIFIGDISGPQGGRLRHHRSHENGRDIDMGMYAKGNVPLKGFACMSEDNLDVPKTWELVDNLLRSRRVQYLFLDNGIQKLLYHYAVTQGNDQAYLDRLFGCAGNQNARTVIQHMRGHRDHMHVRFYAPWSTLAGQLNVLNEKQRDLIELAQGAYLPKKVNYFVQGSESGLGALASSFGVTTKDLCRWNQLRGNEVLTPGSCLVFYKRGFEVEPVRLAQSLQPTGVELPFAAAPRSAAPPPVQLAALQSDLGEAMTDADEPAAKMTRGERRAPAKPKVATQAVRKGDTLAAIAKRNKTDVDTLCRLNGLKKNAKLNPGQKVKVPGAEAKNSHDKGKASAGKHQEKATAKGASTKNAVAKADSKKSGKSADKNNKVASSTKGKQQPVAKGKQPAAKGKGVPATANKNASTKTDKKAAASANAKKSGKNAGGNTKATASKQPDKSKGKSQQAPSKTAVAQSKKTAPSAKKDTGKQGNKPAATNNNGKKPASFTKVAANKSPKAKKPM
jgi:LysM repeat protein/murein endopeptidase